MKETVVIFFAMLAIFTAGCKQTGLSNRISTEPKQAVSVENVSAPKMVSSSNIPGTGLSDSGKSLPKQEQGKKDELSAGFVSQPGPAVYIEHTSFFGTHNTAEFLKSAAEKKGYEVGSVNSARTLIYKDYSISIKGNETIRDELLGNYGDFTKDQLISEGIQIIEESRPKPGMLDFHYVARGIVRGMLRVKTVIDKQGYLKIDALLYEYNVKQTVFFKSHNAVEYAKTKGYKVKDSSSEDRCSYNGDKDYHMLIEGDDVTRDELINDYKNFVRDQLTSGGVQIIESSEKKTAEFDFQYNAEGTIGIIIVRTAIDKQGYINVDVVMCEH